MLNIDHPGNLGFELIHADWPMYPAGHGWQVALRSLGQFPRKAFFTEVSDIDHCYLFVVGDPKKYADAFDERHFHVALWHEDISDLYHKGLVIGAYEITMAEWVERLRKELEGAFFVLPDGQRRPVTPPRVEDYGDNHQAPKLMISRDGLQITAAGWSQLEHILASEREYFHAALAPRVLPIARLGQFDSAVREACVIMENRVRQLVGSSSFGQELIRELSKKLVASDLFLSASIKMLRGDLRTAFKYVRNEFMHNLQELTATQCYAIVARISELMTLLDQVAEIQTLTPRRHAGEDPA